MSLRVTVIYAPAPRAVHEVDLTLDDGATAAQALAASELLAQFPEIDPAAHGVGLWGRQVRPGQVLRDQDRLEIYRPLTVDPKVARRERFQKQGARTTGLFARQRPGGKPGY